MSSESFIRLLSQPLAVSVIVCGAVAVALLLFLAYIDVKYYLRVYRFCRKNAEKSETRKKEFLPPVSLIVYACENAVSLRRNLPELFKQDYPDFEVVVVDDASTDETRDILNLYAERYPRLYSTYVPSDACALSRRKLAITLGFKAVRNDYVVVLDATCLPSSRYWLRNMMCHFSDGVDIVLGYTRFDMSSSRGACYAAYDRMLFSLRYLSCALCGNPYMGEGTNVVYRKSLFFGHKGFSRTLNLRYGDDDLFINEVATPQNTRVEISPESRVDVCTDDFISLWRMSKLRYCFTAPYLRHSRLFLFAFEQLSVYLFYVALVAMSVIQPSYPAVWGAVLLLLLWRGIMQTWVYKRLARTMDMPLLGMKVLLYEWSRPWVDLYYYFSARRRKEENYTWCRMKI